MRSVLLLLPFLTSARPQTESNSSQKHQVDFKIKEGHSFAVERLAEEWAPVLWLAPGERYLPLSVEEFLGHVYPADVNGRAVSESLPLGRESNSVYLVTKRNLDSLKNESSFLNGKDPRKSSVPVYVTVTECTVRPNIPLGNQSQLFFHLSYWMFYPYNEGKQLCFLGRFPAPFLFNTCLGKIKTIGDHVGDFEHVSLSFRGKTVPDEMFLSVHDSGVYYRYDEGVKLFRYDRQVGRKGIEFPSEVKLWKGRPVLFAALGSHGLWSAPGEHRFVRVPKLSDKNGFGVPWLTWKRLEVFHLGASRPPAWMKYLGRWGNPKSNCFPFNKLGVCELSDGPWGILRRHQDFYC